MVSVFDTKNRHMRYKKVIKIEVLPEKLWCNVTTFRLIFVLSQMIFVSSVVLLIKLKTLIILKRLTPFSFSNLIWIMVALLIILSSYCASHNVPSFIIIVFFKLLTISKIVHRIIFFFESL